MDGDLQLANELAHELAAKLNDPALTVLIDGGTEQALRDWVAAHRAEVEGLIFDALPPIPGLREALPDLLPADGWRPRVTFAGATVGVDCVAASVVVGGTTVVLGLLPPTGASLALNAGPAVAGGMVARRGPDSAVGALGVRVGPLEVNGFALLDGLGGGPVSLVVVLGIRFTPPIQLSFGFALSAVGGVVGINHAIDGDALRARLASGSALDALFPEDPIAGAARLLDALAAIFPRVPGQIVVGPTFTITWLDVGATSIVRVDVGLLLQLPDGKVVLIGRARLDLGPILALRADLVGEVDPGRGLVALDAVLVDSRALLIFRVTGSAAFRMSAGKPPYVVVTIGGFYPGFNPQPASIPPQQRVGLALDIPCPLSFRASGYLAITSNTFQVGADIEVGIDLAVISASGFLRFDAIVEFDPFHVHADYAAGWEVSVVVFSGGTTVSGWIDGPGPWTVHASVSISLLIDDFDWSDTFRFGPSGPPPDPPLEHLVDALSPTLGAPSNLHAADAHDPHVAIKPRPGGLAGGRALCSPLARLTWVQDVVPLKLPVVRAGGRRLASEQSVAIAIDGGVAQAGSVAQDWFALGMFIDLPKPIAMLLPPFQLLDGGTDLELKPEDGSMAPATLDYETFFRRSPAVWQVGAGAALAGHVGTSARALAMVSARTASPVVDDRSPLVAVEQETWALTDAGGTTTHPSAVHAVLASRAGGVAHALADEPVAVGAI